MEGAGKILKIGNARNRRFHRTSIPKKRERERKDKKQLESGTEGLESP